MIQQAIDVYQKAIRRNLKEHQFWGGLGAAYREWGSKQIAQQSYLKAVSYAIERLEVNPTDPQVLSQLAGYYADLGRKAEAKATLRKALSIAPKDINVMSRAVTTNELLGDRKEAMNWLRKAAASGQISQEIKYSPEMKNLREDREYQRLLNERSGKK